MKFELTLVVREDEERQFNQHLNSVDRIETDSLIKLASQLQFVLVNIGERLKQRAIDDVKRGTFDATDIPF